MTQKGLNLIKSIERRFRKPNNPQSKPQPSTEKNLGSELKPTSRKSVLRRAWLQATPVNVPHQFMSSTSTLVSPTPTELSLDASKPASVTSVASQASISTSITTVLFEPVRARAHKVFMTFPTRKPAELGFVLPLRKTRSMADLSAARASIVPTITLTSPSDEADYALCLPRGWETSTDCLAPPSRAARHWPHPFGPWLRVERQADGIESPGRLTDDRLLNWPVEAPLPPRLITDAQRKTIALVEQISLNLDLAQHALHSRFDVSWKYVTEEEDDDEDDDDEEDDEDDDDDEGYTWPRSPFNTFVSLVCFSLFTSFGVLINLKSTLKANNQSINQNVL